MEQVKVMASARSMGAGESYGLLRLLQKEVLQLLGLGLGIPVTELDQLAAKVLIEQQIAGEAHASFAHLQAATHQAAEHQRQGINIPDGNVINGLTGRNVEQINRMQVQTCRWPFPFGDQFYQLVDQLQALDIVLQGVEKEAVEHILHDLGHGGHVVNLFTAGSNHTIGANTNHKYATGP